MPSRPVSASKVMLCIELTRSIGPEKELGYIASIPGRESVSRRVYKLQDGRVSDRQLEDLAAAISQLVTDCFLVASEGVQVTLDL